MIELRLADENLMSCHLLKIGDLTQCFLAQPVELGFDSRLRRYRMSYKCETTDVTRSPGVSRCGRAKLFFCCKF